MLKQVISVFVGAAVWATAVAEGAKPKTELLGTVEFASFDEVQQKMADLGATVNNPVVPMLVMPSLQNFLNENCGKFRKDAPMTFYCYAQMEALRKAMSDSSDEVDVEDAIDPVFVYPTAEDQTAFMASHPEAQKAADGTIKLDDDTVVVFSADGRTCAFAQNVETAKRALGAKPSPAAKRPLMRLDVAEPAFALIADFQRKVSKVSEAQTKQLQSLDLTNGTEQIMAAAVKVQLSHIKRQNAFIRAFAKGCMIVDLDDTGFVVKASATAKPNAPKGVAAGFRLPSGALDVAPAGAKMCITLNPFAGECFTSEKEFAGYIDEAMEMVNAIASCAAKNLSDPKYAPTVEGLRVAVNDFLAAAKADFSPSDWYSTAIAFGPKQEPYMVQGGACKSSASDIALATRFFAAVADAIGKSWPGILSANGASLTIDWERLMDAAAEASGVKGDAQKELANAKKKVAAVLGSTKTEVACKATSATSYGSVIGPVGFTPPAVKSNGEARFAAAMPEAAKDRPSGAFYFALYSFLRDNALPIAMKVMPKDKVDQVQPILAVLPAAGENSALAAAAWFDKDSSFRFIFRITSGEIRNYGAAANAAMAVSASQGQKASGSDEDK